MLITQLPNNSSNGQEPTVNATPWRSVLRAKYPHAGFDRVVTAGTIIEAICGEPLQLVANVFNGDVAWTLLRSPPAPNPRQAACTFNGGRLIAAMPGRYDIGVTVCGWSRSIFVAAFPQDVNKSLEYQQDGDARRRRLRAILKEATPDSVIAALETGKWDPSMLSVLVGRPKGTPLSLRAYG